MKRKYRNRYEENSIQYVISPKPNNNEATRNKLEQNRGEFI